MNFSNANIKEIPTFYRFKQLKVLNLSNNQICDIAPNYLPRELEELDLSYNCIHIVYKDISNPNKIISSIVNKPYLKKLDLSYNKIEKLHKNLFDDARNLEDINLEGNQIEYGLQAFNPLKKLKYLNLKKNYIDQIEEIRNLSLNPELDWLNIAKNPISYFTNYVGQITNMLKRRSRFIRIEFGEFPNEE